MTKNLHTLHLGLAATTAAFALSATPLFAQAADAPLVAPPAASASAAAPAPTTAEPMIVAPPVTTTQSATPPAATTGGGFSSNTIPTLDLSDSEPAAAVAPAPSARVATSARATAPASAAPAPTPAAPRTIAAASAPVVPVVIPMPAAPKVAPVADPTPATPVTRVSAPAASGDATLPIAIGGLALLGLAGAGLALSRRKRDGIVDEDYAVPATEPIADSPSPAYVVATERERPFTLATPVAAAMSTPNLQSAQPGLADGPRTAVPAGFDTSRFGRHVKAAYAGPTPDNPSLSLKRRLKRASFMDQRERMGAAPPEPTIPLHADVALDSAALAANRTGHVTTRIPRQPRPTFRPAFQR